MFVPELLGNASIERSLSEQIEYLDRAIQEATEVPLYLIHEKSDRAWREWWEERDGATRSLRYRRACLVRMMRQWRHREAMMSPFPGLLVPESADPVIGDERQV